MADAMLPLALFPTVLAAQGEAPARLLWRTLWLASPFALVVGLANPQLECTPMLALAAQRQCFPGRLVRLLRRGPVGGPAASHRHAFDGPDPVKVPAVELHALAHTYADGTPALQGVDLRVMAGPARALFADAELLRRCHLEPPPGALPA